MQEPIGALIAGTRRRIKQAVAARLAGSGLSPQQFGLLLAIADEPGLSLREIQARLHVDAPTASRVVSNLVSRRFVRVGGDPQDRRRCRLEATPTGRALADRLRPLRDELRRELLVGMTSDEQDSLRELLRRVTENAARFESRGDDGQLLRRARAMSVLVALALAYTTAGCAPRARASASAEPAVPVVIGEVQKQDVPDELRAVGQIEPYSSVAVKAQVQGVVTAIHFREGSDVRAGDLLFSIDPRPYQAALHQVEGALARDEAELQNAELEQKRAETLFKQGILAQGDYDVKLSAAAMQTAQVKADRAAIEKARLDLEWCEIRSPLDARAGTVLVYPGNVVKAPDGPALVTLNQVSPVNVTFAVPETRLADVRGAAAPLVQATAAGDPTPVAGQLSFLDNQVDRSTGTVKLKATFANRDRKLWPGQFADVRLVLRTRAGAMVVPSSAVQAGQAGSFVFVVKGDMTVEARNVRAQLLPGDIAVVESGLSVGEKVVVDGQLRLVPGSLVTASAPVGPKPAEAPK